MPRFHYCIIPPLLRPSNVTVKHTLMRSEETDSIFIPSVFVSRASYLFLRDLLANGTESGLSDSGLWLEIGRGSDEGG